MGEMTSKTTLEAARLEAAQSAGSARADDGVVAAGDCAATQAATTQDKRGLEQEATSQAVLADLRHDWKRAEVEAIYRMALPELVFRAQTVHRAHHAADRVQTCQLISIKTGGCPEDCAYCPQSAHYETSVERQGLLDAQHVVDVAREAA